MLKPIIGGYGTPKFRGENFHRWLQNHENHECFLPRKFCLYGMYMCGTMHGDNYPHITGVQSVTQHLVLYMKLQHKTDQ